MKPAPRACIFISSPGDVASERDAARTVIERLRTDPLQRGEIDIEAVAWDDPNAPTPTLATMTPQAAINAGLAKPSECQIVIVILWSRMGTPLPAEYVKPDGTRYQSGTEWEYLDAVNAPRPTPDDPPFVVVYRRTGAPQIALDDKDFDARTDQWRQVQGFFAGFTNADGSLKGGYHTHTTPEDFSRQLDGHLKQLLKRVIDAHKRTADAPPPAIAVSAPPAPAAPLWEGSPFPGLRAFTPADARIYFGRGAETDAVVERLRGGRLLAIVGASGSGKSSLIGAGIIPRLKANAIDGSKDWLLPEYSRETGWTGIRFTPGEIGDNPFMALANKLFIPMGWNARDLNAALVAAPQAIHQCIHEALKGRPRWAELLIFIDQFEELFTLCDAKYCDPFAEMIRHAIAHRARVVLTVRADFYGRVIETPTLEALFKDATYPLGRPGTGALYAMITKPADAAGLTFEPDLPGALMDDTGSGAGALALMAYALDELYHAAGVDKRLTFAAYQAIGGVDGAIGRRAEQTYDRLGLADKDSVLQRVFRELVTVDERGTATRQRAAQSRFGQDERALVDAFTNARLLVKEDGFVEVAHEALFRSWERLRTWIAEAQEDLILLRQVRAAAHDWGAKREREPNQDFDYLRWPQERLVLVYAMRERLKPELNELEREFIEPEQNRLLREIDQIATDHKRRRWIGERLATIGDLRTGIGLDDHGLPKIDWLPVTPGGEITIEQRTFTVQSFYIAKYLITYPQFQAFRDAPDGFNDARWWAGMPDKYKKQNVSAAVAQYDNYPRDSVSWYQAVAFSRWLDWKCRELGIFARLPVGTPNGVSASVGASGDRGRAVARPYETIALNPQNWQIRLPTEWEWQWMAQGGGRALEYPWGEWQEGYANTSEAGLNRTTAVGMYPHGRAECGALDVAGNLGEWCLNDHGSPETISIINKKYKVLRGGSFLNPQDSADASYRNYYGSPSSRNYDLGFRLVVSAPMRL